MQSPSKETEKMSESATNKGKTEASPANKNEGSDINMLDEEAEKKEANNESKHHPNWENLNEELRQQMVTFVSAYFKAKAPRETPKEFYEFLRDFSEKDTEKIEFGKREVCRPSEHTMEALDKFRSEHAEHLHGSSLLDIWYNVLEQAQTKTNKKIVSKSSKNEGGKPDESGKEHSKEKQVGENSNIIHEKAGELLRKKERNAIVEEAEEISQGSPNKEINQVIQEVVPSVKNASSVFSIEERNPINSNVRQKLTNEQRFKKTEKNDGNPDDFNTNPNVNKNTQESQEKEEKRPIKHQPEHEDQYEEEFGKKGDILHLKTDQNSLIMEEKLVNLPTTRNKTRSQFEKPVGVDAHASRSLENNKMKTTNALKNSNTRQSQQKLNTSEQKSKKTDKNEENPGNFNKNSGINTTNTQKRQESEEKQSKKHQTEQKKDAVFDEYQNYEYVEEGGDVYKKNTQNRQELKEKPLEKNQQEQEKDISFDEDKWGPDTVLLANQREALLSSYAPVMPDTYTRNFKIPCCCGQPIYIQNMENHLKGFSHNNNMLKRQKAIARGVFTRCTECFMIYKVGQAQQHRKTVVHTLHFIGRMNGNNFCELCQLFYTDGDLNEEIHEYNATHETQTAYRCLYNAQLKNINTKLKAEKEYVARFMTFFKNEKTFNDTQFNELKTLLEGEENEVKTRFDAYLKANEVRKKNRFIQSKKKLKEMKQQRKLVREERQRKDHEEEGPVDLSEDNEEEDLADYIEHHEEDDEDDEADFPEEEMPERPEKPRKNSM